jgi:IS30 family transposase
LAIVWALTRLKEHLYGQKIIIYTDHKALEYLLTQKQINYMAANWADILMDFNMEIVHRPGIAMILPDALSRLFTSLEGGEMQASILRKKIKKLAPLKLQDGDGKPAELSQFIRERLGKSNPADNEKQALLQNVHQEGHFGAEQMFKQLWWKGYYWPTLRDDCKNIYNQCHTCQQHNIQREGFHPMSSIHAEFPWEHIAIDLAGPLLTSKQGNNMILVVTDVCTRFTLVRPLKSKMAKDVARTLYHIIGDFGVPKIIQSDNGKEFVNSIIHEMKELLGIGHRLISPYHPEANGTAEAAVKSVKSLLQKTIKGNILNWDKYLPTVQMSLNYRIMKRTGSKPFDLLFGRSWLGWQDFRGTQSQPMTISTLKQHHKDLKEIVYPFILVKNPQTHLISIRILTEF